MLASRAPSFSPLIAPGVTHTQVKRMQALLLKSAFERRSAYLQDMAQISGVAERKDVNKLMSNLQDLTKDKMSLVDANMPRTQDLYMTRGAVRKQAEDREAKSRSVERAYEDICGELLGLVASRANMTNLRM